MLLAAEAWLALLAGLVSTQLTLLIRAGVSAFAIMAALSWVGGGVLLWDWQQQRGLGTPSRPQLLAGLVLLLWCLLVLSLPARLYDPLLHLVPLAGLLGLALVAGVGPGRPLALQLAVIGLLLPAQVLINRFLPTQALAWMTAHGSAFLLWLLGQPATALGTSILMPGKELVVDLSCTGVNIMSLNLAALVVIALLIPVLPWRTLLTLAGVSLLVAFAVNALRVALLGFMDPESGEGWRAQVSSFHFWHQGAGSQLFSLLAMGLTCALMLAVIESTWRQQRRP